MSRIGKSIETKICGCLGATWVTANEYSISLEENENV